MLFIHYLSILNQKLLFNNWYLHEYIYSSIFVNEKNWTYPRKFGGKCDFLILLCCWKRISGVYLSWELKSVYRSVSRNTKRNGVRWEGEGRNEESEKSKYVLHFVFIKYRSKLLDQPTLFLRLHIMDTQLKKLHNGLKMGRGVYLWGFIPKA